jgi:competence protein ComEA
MHPTRQVFSPPLAVLVGAIIACAAVAISLLPITRSEDGDVIIIANPTVSEVVVEIRGEVRAAGVYRLPEDARVGDLLEAAGGANENADLTSLNLARRLVDAEQIVILPRRSATPLGPDKVAPGSDSPQGVTYRVNINTASSAELESLPGIGPVIADRIVEYRINHGPFTDISDLTRVDGISDNLLADIRSLITVGP